MEADPKTGCERARRAVEVSAAGMLLFMVPACGSVSFRPDVAAQTERVDRARLRAHVEALDAIGPRPASDADATRATLEYLSRELESLGYELHEERLEVQFTSRPVAIVRPVGDPDAEPVEIEMSPDLMKGGEHAVQARSDRLREEGWQFDGYVVRALDEMQVRSVPNLIAIKLGEEAPGEVVELSAHYDTVAHSPGADDNSSGVAALLEVARVVADVPLRRTLRLCFFGAEEIGLRGSRRHVEEIDSDTESRVLGLINLDGVGFTARGPGSQREPEGVPWFLSFPEEGDFVVVVGKWSSGWLGNLFESAIDAYAPELPYYSANRIGSFFPDADRSDHAHYWRVGLPAIFISDTGEFRGSNYHTPKDTADQLDYEFLEQVTRATAGAALHWTELAD